MRLRKEVKKQIVAAAIERSAFTKQAKDLRIAFAEHAEKVRRKFVTVEQEEKIAQLVDNLTALRKDPDIGDYIPPALRELTRNNRCDCIGVNVAGSRRDLYYDGSQKAMYSWHKAGEAERIHRIYQGFLRNDGVVPYVRKLEPLRDCVLTADDPLTQELYDLDHQLEELTSQREGLRHQLEAILDSVTTDEQLYKVWPEAKAFVPVIEKASSPTATKTGTAVVSAQLLADVNKTLGLP